MFIRTFGCCHPCKSVQNVYNVILIFLFRDAYFSARALQWNVQSWCLLPGKTGIFSFNIKVKEQRGHALYVTLPTAGGFPDFVLGL